ncbi:hypothetical protein [Streptomyces sp. NPDC056883]
MMTSLGAPSLEGMLKDLETRVKALETAPMPTIPDHLEVESISFRNTDRPSSAWVKLAMADRDNGAGRKQGFGSFYISEGKETFQGWVMVNSNGPGGYAAVPYEG